MTQTITLVLDGSGVSAPLRGARVRLLANQVIPNNASTPVSWAAVDRDTGGIFNPTQPTRLQCPDTGKAVLRASVVWASAARSARSVTMTMNGAATRGVGYQRVDGPAPNAPVPGAALAVSSSILDVQAGDYFELLVEQEAGGNVNLLADPATWFEIQYADSIKGDPGLAGPPGPAGAPGPLGAQGAQGPQGVP